MGGCGYRTKAPSELYKNIRSSQFTHRSLHIGTVHTVLSVEKQPESGSSSSRMQLVAAIVASERRAKPPRQSAEAEAAAELCPS